MAEHNSTRSRKNQEPAKQKPEICTECGQPVYACGCAERWENEGGLSNPQIDINDDNGKSRA